MTGGLPSRAKYFCKHVFSQMLNQIRGVVEHDYPVLIVIMSEVEKFQMTDSSLFTHAVHLDKYGDLSHLLIRLLISIW